MEREDDTRPSSRPNRDDDGNNRPTTARRLEHDDNDSRPDDPTENTTPADDKSHSIPAENHSPDGRDHEHGHTHNSHPDSDPDAALKTPSKPPAHSDPSNESMLPPPRPQASAVPDSSFVEGATFDDSRHDSLAESAVRAHLQDVESSFVSRLSPIPTITHEGTDDTYLFDGAAPARSPAPPRHTPAKSPSPSPRPTSEPDRDEKSDANDLSELRPQDSASADVSDTTSALETMSSSPAAAAAARTISRAVSSASNRTDKHSHGPSPADQTDEEPPFLRAESAADSVSTTLRSKRSDGSLRGGLVDAGSTPGHALSYGTRPKYLRSRGASQRSSVSSFITNPDTHDDLESEGTANLGADFALQSGGAAPTLSLPRSLSSILSRSVSIGSMVSGMDDPESLPNQLETLDEVDNAFTPRRLPRNDDDLLATPKPSKENLTAPTDTVIARHVRNVQVPESLAKEYRNKSGFVTPRKPSDMPLSASTRSGKNLTLKEQSSTIERLSKENFDLKLKVMFLSDRLDKLSEEGVREMISENVELKTNLAVIQRDNKALRRRVKELEKQLKDDQDRPGTARSGGSSNDSSSDHDAQEREEELIYLRERVEEYVTEIERLRNDSMAKEAEKRKLSEVVRSLGERTSGNLGSQEEADVWKDLLEQETARREQSDEDNRKLRDELFRIKQEMSSGHGGLHHTTNIYNITKKPRQTSPSRPVSGLSGDVETNGGFSAASTLVDELRRESEQLRHENAELRREVGAQTSMLTSRNREKERLYQEIEDLKMAQRRGGPAPSTVDSLLERSASRAGAHHRSMSRVSASRTQMTEIDELEREELENKLAETRDKISEIKLQNQELQRELEGCMADFETAVEGKRQAEEIAVTLQEDLDNAMNDLVALQAERDEALREQADMEAEFESLRKEAQEEIDALEGEADQRSDEIQRLQLELNDRTENFDALQEEMRKMSEALVGLEDEQAAKFRRIQQLEQDLADANKESEELETKLLESNDKAQRLSVQQESSQGEIAFLREEQESDKIRIGDLEAALANTEQSLREERDRVKELEQRLATERRQHEMVSNQEKEEVQQFVNELNREMSAAKDEARRLRKSLTSREVEATEWKERLMELENNLREALGDLNGTRSSLLKSIAKLQRELENTVRELDTTKASLVEKDRLIKQRDALLESHGLESRKLAGELEKERQAHRTTRNQFETFQKTHLHVSRTVSTQDLRISELESTRAQDKKRISQLEATFRDQLTERNNLLLVLWTRLSALCGTDWAHDNSLINGRALPSLEAVATMLPGFSKNLLAAVKTIETMVGGFSSRIKGVERDLWREYQSLENNLESRTKKLERLETIVRNSMTSGTLGSYEQARMSRLEDAYRQLKVENATLRTAQDVRSRAAYSANNDPNAAMPEPGSGSPSPSIPTGPRERERKPRKGERASTMTRSASSHTVTTTGTGTTPTPGSANHNPFETTLAERDPTDNRWIFKLRDLENKLKAEREGRSQDRNAARQRLGGLETENRDLRSEVSRIRRANGQLGDS
ncbi:Putative centrosomin motif 1, Mto2p-binding domain-containing protein [Colletotrichum destructivum]|uniref:Centrosomin motif 1, Mto2p-binding domain-containing protein n=1 Tax=Colletotrichum destructivum TaxID=34406 RepID=A0AAX4J129_9PEZI|nr:Putative centrosomin motif 1, Mto2p-binding domain-containing protein [Colletotrichum destructivum]